jgi:hypothetical protein
MGCKRRTRAIIAVSLVAVLSISARVVSAARGLPAPLLSQFEDGYGIVAAEVADAKPVPAEGQYYVMYDCTFKIHSVAAQPVKGDAFTLHSGDSVKIPLSAGYACQIEEDVKSALAKGNRYYLIIRKRSDGTFEHADGRRRYEPLKDSKTRKATTTPGFVAWPPNQTRAN